MDARFELEGLHRPVIVLKPEHGIESILMAAFLRYDSNVFSVYVERYQDGQIESVTIKANVSE